MAMLGERRGTKRWNVVGSKAAKLRMAELRARKRKYLCTELLWQWCRARGFTAIPRDWLERLGLQPGCGTEAAIAALRKALP